MAEHARAQELMNAGMPPEQLKRIPGETPWLCSRQLELMTENLSDPRLSKVDTIIAKIDSRTRVHDTNPHCMCYDDCSPEDILRWMACIRHGASCPILSLVFRL